jgi:hypothetical protein
VAICDSVYYWVVGKQKCCGFVMVLLWRQSIVDVSIKSLHEVDKKGRAVQWGSLCDKM